MADEDSLKGKPNENNRRKSNVNEFSMQKLNETVNGNNPVEKFAPPDGDYGWIVVGGSFSIHMIADGILNSMGIFEEKIRSELKETETLTSLVPSVASGMSLCAGPIASLLVKKKGCRTVTIAGSLLAAVSLFVSFFAKNVPTLIVTVGLGFGTALALVFVPAIVIVTTYFEKNRSLATGIAVSGTGVGTSAFALLIEMFIREYGWDYNCLILSGIVLIIFSICGVLFKPLKPSSQQIHFTEPSDRYQRDETNGIELRGNSSQYKLKSQTSSQLTPNENVSATTEDKQSKKRKRENLTLDIRKTKSNRSSEKPDQTNIRYSLSQPSINIDTKIPKDYHKEWNSGIMSINNNGTVALGSLSSLSTQKTQSEFTMEVDKYGSLRRKNDNEEKKSSKTYCGCISAHELKSTIELMNFGLLKDPIFVVFLVSNFCTSIAFYIPIFCIPQHLEEIGMKSAGSTILLIYGIVNTLGRIIVGYISDKPFVNRLWVFNFSLVICGIGSAGVVACNQFSEFAICLSVYGITISAYVTLRSVILCDLFGLENLESAFGLLLLFEGIATFVGHPIAGLLHNKYGSYNPAFWFAGAMIAFSGLILFALPQLQKYIEKRQLRCGVDHIENVIAT